MILLLGLNSWTSQQTSMHMRNKKVAKGVKKQGTCVCTGSQELLHIMSTLDVADKLFEPNTVHPWCRWWRWGPVPILGGGALGAMGSPTKPDVDF